MLSSNTTNTNIHLNPALIPFGSRSEFSLKPGRYICQIHAKQGNLIFHHFSYDIYNGTWSEHPEQNEPDSLVIHEGETKNISFTCKKHYGYSDDICIINDSLLHPAQFTCSCIAQQKIPHHS